MSQLNLYDTLAAEKRPFQPIDPNHVTMYVCGPTVYNFVHIGNARPAVVFDTLFRLLKHHYPKVSYARNLTDVDDKINAAAKQNNESIYELTARYIDAYQADMSALKNLTPTVQPKATEHIEGMQTMINQLIDKGFAYQENGHVLFHIPAMKDYGKLSKQSLEDVIAGARVEVSDYKKHAADFVLWKPSTDDLPGWDSPWGRGRPGWHLECSAMIKQHLGVTIDIHGGGQDLIFPHHENEIAQSQCAHDGAVNVNYWLHNGYINMDGEKMSKSLGNVKTVQDLLKKFPGEVLRFALLSSHYRSPLNWSLDLINQAKNGLDRLYNSLRDIRHLRVEVTEKDVASAVLDALNDDLNTPKAIAQLHDIAHRLNKEKDEEQQKQLKKQLLASGGLLGLLDACPEAWFCQSMKEQLGLCDEDIEALIEQRIAAKKAKDYERADSIRKHLKEKGVTLEDTREGTRWSRC